VTTPFLYPAREIRGMIDQPASPAHGTFCALSLEMSWQVMPTQSFWAANRIDRRLPGDVALHGASLRVRHVQLTPLEAQSTSMYRYFARR
jgi:hypothetical protein